MTGRFRAGFDGGSRGNPGPAAWGVVLLDDADRPVEGFAGTIGRATNNVAEYSGLLEALALAAERGADDVTLLADSELVVRQILGEYRVRHPDLVPLHAEARRRAAAFAAFRIAHGPRARNKDADKLLNRALDLAAASPGADPVRLHEVFETPSR
jgi:ribonuclease HI